MSISVPIYTVRLYHRMTGIGARFFDSSELLERVNYRKHQSTERRSDDDTGSKMRGRGKSAGINQEGGGLCTCTATVCYVYPTAEVGGARA